MSEQDPVVIVGMARTPMGGLLGDLSSLTASELGAIAIEKALAEAKVQQHEVRLDVADDRHGLCDRAGLGSPSDREKPSQPYNLLLSRRWLALIRRHCEGVRGFSVNALGFAGYLLSTEASDRRWLQSVGPESLLRDVLPPGPRSHG